MASYSRKQKGNLGERRDDDGGDGDGDEEEDDDDTGDGRFPLASGQGQCVKGGACKFAHGELAMPPPPRPAAQPS